MKADSNRRQFIKTCSAFCAGCAFFLHSNRIAAADDAGSKPEIAPDPNEHTYCGYQCSDECKLYKATITNDEALKKEAYAEWQMKERYGMEFDPEQVFCYKCKADDKPMSRILQKCTVRHCARGKELSACFQCKDLKTCDKELWQRFPDFKKHVTGLQEKYVTLGENELK
jgi:anaerobic selenocysteine-containing dehydrogenase